MTAALFDTPADPAPRPEPRIEHVLTTFVAGKPAPQGSKRYLGAGRPMIESSKAVAPWRADIRTHLLIAHDGPPLAGAVHLVLEFVLPRPTSTPKRRTPAAVKRPDLDKLIRAVLDAVTSAGVWRDDSQVVQLDVRKRIAEADETTGCRIVIAQEIPS